MFKSNIAILFLLVLFSGCSKNQDFTFLDKKDPDAATSLGWGLSIASDNSAPPSIIAKWKVTHEPDADAQYIQFFSDESCSEKYGDEKKLALTETSYTLPADKTHLGPFTYKLKIADKNGNSSNSACSQVYKVFGTNTSSFPNGCVAPGESEDKIASFPLPEINRTLNFVHFSKVTILDKETMISYPAQSISNISNTFTMKVPRSKKDDLTPIAGGALIGKREVEITYGLNTGYEFKENKTIDLDGRTPKVQLVIDPIYTSKFYSKDCDLSDPKRTCEKFIPIELREVAVDPSEPKGCVTLADEPFHISFIDNTDIEFAKEASSFKEKTHKVEWTFEDYKRIRIKVTVKSNTGMEYYLLSEGLFNSAYQYIAGMGFDGDGGPAKDAKLTNPTELAYNTKSNYYCFFENAARKIRCSRPGEKIFTLAGNGAIGSEFLEAAVLTGADVSKVSLSKVAALSFVGDDLYFISEDSIIRKISLQIDAYGRVKAKEGARLEALTPYFSSLNNIRFKCKTYSIPGVCQLNQEFEKIPAGMILAFNGFYYEPNDPAFDPYFNKDIIYLLTQRQLYKYDIKNNLLEPVLGVNSFEKVNGDAPQYSQGVAAHSELELFFARSVTRGPKNNLIINTVRQDGVNKGSHNIIMLNLEGAPSTVPVAQAVNSDGVRAPFAKHIFTEHFDEKGNKIWPSWPVYSKYFNTLRGGTLVATQSNQINRIVVPLTENTPLPIEINQCQGCRFSIKHPDDKGQVEGMAQDFYFAVRSASETALHLVGTLKSTGEIVEHRLPLGSASTNVQTINTYNILAGKSYSIVPEGNSVVNNGILLDRPNYVTLDRKRNHLYFMDGGGQDIKKLDLGSKQISSFYGLKDYREFVNPSITYNNRNQMLTFREKDDSLIFMFHAGISKLLKKSISVTNRSVAPGFALPSIHNTSVTLPTTSDGVPVADSKYGLYEGSSFIFAHPDGSLFMKDYNYTVTSENPRHARLFKILPCNAAQKDHSCATVNDSEAKSFFLAGSKVDTDYAKVTGSFFPTDVALGWNKGFAIDKEENIYLYDETNVYLANHKFNTVKPLVSVVEAKVAQVTVGELDSGKKKILYVLASKKNARSLEEVYETAPEGQDHLFQEGLGKYYLYSAVLKENGVEVVVPELKELTDFGEGALQVPMEMLVDVDGNVIISETGANRILKYFVAK